MNFNHTEWIIGKIIELIEEKKLNLNPLYQRNAVWPLSSKRKLIDTILAGYPIPNFFIRELDGGFFEMVDGQKRARAVMDFWNGVFPDGNKIKLSPDFKVSPKNKEFLEEFRKYPLNVTLLKGKFLEGQIESFFTLVNSSGLRLNRPELRKAEFFDTRFLKLVNEIAACPQFENLNLFSSKSQERVNDLEFISELLSFLKFGFTDKKEKVDDAFSQDISEEEYFIYLKKSRLFLRKLIPLTN